MKTTFISARIFYSIFLVAILTVCASIAVMAQDAPAKKSKKATVIVKITNDDGKIKVLDTTFNLNNQADQEKFDVYMKQYEGNLKSLEDNLRNMEVTVNIPDLADSMNLDSLTKQITVMSKSFDRPHFRFHQRPDEYNYDYDFDMPAPPSPPELPEHSQQFWRQFGPEREMKVFRHNGRGESLNDILGDIPMDHVKSYSIKDKKNGKRIIIDISDYPFIERQDKVIIMHEPSRPPDPNGRRRIEKKIIIHHERKDKEDEENDEE